MKVELTEDMTYDREDSFMSDVDQGLAGENDGYPNGFTRINKYIHNVQKGRYYLIGADSGVGKTTLVDRAFVIEPILFCKEQKLPIRVDYFSFEIGKSIKRASWASRFVFKHHKLRMPVDYILSQGAQKLSTEHRVLLNEIAPELEDFMRSIHWVWNTMTPSNVFKYLFRIATTRGAFIYETYFDADEVEKKRIVGYKAKNPSEPWIIVMDHIALLEEENGLSLKQTIDKMSAYFVFFRNICNATVVPVQQFNSELGSIERQKYKKSALAPQKSDFGDSKYTYRDADIVLGLLKPIQFDMAEYMEWDITRLGNYAIWMFLMKNRYGPANKSFGLIPDPVIGTFTELPPNTAMDEDYYAIASELKGLENNNYGLSKTS